MLDSLFSQGNLSQNSASISQAICSCALSPREATVEVSLPPPRPPSLPLSLPSSPRTVMSCSCCWPALVLLRMVYTSISKMLVLKITVANEAVISFQIPLDWKNKQDFFYSILLHLWRLLPDSAISHSFSRLSSLSSYMMFDCIPVTTLKLAYPFKGTEQTILADVSPTVSKPEYE